MWKSIICDHREEIEIKSKVDDIYNALVRKIYKVNGFSLYGDKSGICLFLAYYLMINKRCSVDIDDLLVSIVDNAYEYKLVDYKDITFYSEMAWLLCHLYEMKLININVNDYFSGIDESLYEGMILLLNKKEYGCMNGAISIGIYFYYRYILGCNNCGNYLESFVDSLKRLSIEENDTVRWLSVINYMTLEQGYNLGIAHGIPGILLFLRKLYISDIKKDIVSDMIIKTSNFLLLQKHSLKDHKSFFYNTSSVSFKSGCDTRLGWCYGDMSVAYALFMAGSLNGMERQDIKEIAMDILIETTTRIDSLNSGIVDAGLCHGAAGVAHIYNRLYQQVDKSIFRDAASYWYKETLRSAKYNNEYAGYSFSYYSKKCKKNFSDSEKKLYELHNLSFITGIAGTGLSLLSAVYPIEPSWDMCLLLS